jgi:hypothetical protein
MIERPTRQAAGGTAEKTPLRKWVKQGGQK